MSQVVKTHPVILLAGDDALLRGSLRQALQAGDYRVLLATGGEEALYVASTFLPDLIILDLSVGGRIGLDICRKLRGRSQRPILVLSSGDDVQDKVRALDTGADDILTKPFNADELLARIRSHLRRATVTAHSAGLILNVGEVVLNRTNHKATRGGLELKLTNIEFSLLACLMHNADKVVNYALLLSCGWSPGAGDLQTLRVHILNLRRKLEENPHNPKFIVTVPGVGYCMRAPDE